MSNSVVVENLVKIYGKQRAVNDVSFSINRGEIVGLLGPNGAGKSTTMKILTCYLPQTSGKATLCGFDVVADASEVKKRVGYLSESNPLYFDMYVQEYLEFMSGLKGIRKDVRSKVNEVIERTGITPERRKKIGQLSKGFKQRVGLAQTLLNDPEVLILDEPTSGLDPNQISDIRQLISDLGKERTVILSTHILQEVEMICNRAIIINKGNKVADDSIHDLKNKMQGSKVLVVQWDKDIQTTRLSREPFLKKVIAKGDNTYELLVNDFPKAKQEVFRFSVENGLTILSLYEEEQKLEEIFQALTRSTTQN